MDNPKHCRICGREISNYEFSYRDAMCYACLEDRHFDELAERLKNNEETETFCEDEIICPYCGNRMADDDGYFVQEGGGEFTCEECNKTFDFKVNMEITYSTKRKEENND